MSIVNEKDILSGIIIRDVPMQLSDIELSTLIGSLNEIEDGKFSFIVKDKNGKYDDMVVEIAENCDCLDFGYNKIDDERGLLIFVGEDRISNERFIVIKKIFNMISVGGREQKKIGFDFSNLDNIENYFSNNNRLVVESSVRRIFDLSNVFNFNERVFVVGSSSGYEITFINFKDVYDNLDNEFLKVLGFEFIEFNSDGITIKCKFTINGETFVDNVDARYFISSEAIVKFFVDFISNKISLNNKMCCEFLGDKYKQPVLFMTDSKRICLDNNFGFGFINYDNPVFLVSSDEMYNIFDLEKIYFENKDSIEQRKYKISELGRYMGGANILFSDVIDTQAEVDDVTFLIDGCDIVYLDKYGNCFFAVSSECSSFSEGNSMLKQDYKILYGDIAIQELGRRNISNLIDLSIDELSLVLNVLKDGLTRKRIDVFVKNRY